jgi:hypothetical protein
MSHLQVAVAGHRFKIGDVESRRENIQSSTIDEEWFSSLGIWRWPNKTVTKDKISYNGLHKF